MIDLPFLSRRRAIQLIGASALPFPAFAAKRPPIEAPIVVEDGRLWVGAQIGGRALRFIVDTGAASNFIRPELAKEMGLANISAGNVVGGVGNRQAVVGTVEARDVLVGGVVRQPRMQFSTYDFGRGAGPDAAGLLAAGLVTAYDCDLVLGDTVGRWRIWLDGRDGAPAGTLLPGTTISHRSSSREASERIVVTAMVDGKPYRLMVDTGAPRSLMLFSRATARSGLWDAPRWTPFQIRGFGGASERLGRLMRATRLDFGPLALNRPYVVLTDPGSAAFGDIDGVIGLPLISLFDWSIDASAAKIGLTRNARRAAAPPYNRSGLWLKREADGSATIHTVGAGSPAAANGLMFGERIAPALPFAQALPLLNGAAGTTVELPLARGTTVKLVLADYL